MAKMINFMIFSHYSKEKKLQFNSARVNEENEN